MLGILFASELKTLSHLQLQPMKESKVRLFGSTVETRQLLHQQGKLKILGHFDKSPIQTIVLSLIQYKAHSVSSFICANRAGRGGGGNRKHLIKSKLIFQQFELTELCYDGSHRRILAHSPMKRKGLFCVVTWCPRVLLMYFCAVFVSKPHGFFSFLSWFHSRQQTHHVPRG